MKIYLTHLSAFLVVILILVQGAHANYGLYKGFSRRDSLVNSSLQQQQRSSTGMPEQSRAAVSILSEGVRSGLGTGFYISKDGLVLTCYHVIAGATKINVIDRPAYYEDVTVVSISPKYDLALLKVDVNNVPFIPISDELPSRFYSAQMDVYGYPGVLNSQKSHLIARAVSDHYVKSESILQSNISSSARRESVFAIKSVDLISLDMTIYNGISGAPLLFGNRAVGVISGSIQQGGAIAWAIPLKYRSSMTQVNKKASAIREWPPLALMSNNWRNLRKEAGFGPKLHLAINRFSTAHKNWHSDYAQRFKTMEASFKNYTNTMHKYLDIEIKRLGKDYPMSRFKPSARMKEAGMDIYYELGEKLKVLPNKLTECDDEFSSALNNMTSEMERYMLNMPQTRKNLTLLHDVSQEITAINESIMSDSVEFQAYIERWDDDKDSIISTDVETLREAKFKLTRIESFQVALVRRVEKRLDQGSDSLNDMLAVIEKLFQAELDPSATSERRR